MKKTYRNTVIFTGLSIPLYSLFMGIVIAAEIEMICKNPRHAYQAIFDDNTNTFRLNTAGVVTNYNVMRVNKTGKGMIVAGKTVEGGPDFVAYFGENQRIEFIVDGSTFQTDPCEQK